MASNTWVSDWSNIGQCFIYFYLDLFSSSDHTFPNHLENLIHRVLSGVDNSGRCEIPDPNAIKATVFSFKMGKSPGSGGFTPTFYKKFWDIMGLKVIQAIQAFFLHETLSNSMNNTFFVMIPKFGNFSKVEQFCPIALCNFVYKIITKTLANRLKCVLDNIISPWQSAFIPGRAMHDNIIIAYEYVLPSQEKKKVRLHGH